MLKVIPFEPEHMINIEKEDPDTDVLMSMGDLEERAKQYAACGPGITILEGDVILATGGIIQFWKGVGEVWMIVSPSGRKSGTVVYRHMKRFLDKCFKEYGFHRIQTNILYDFKKPHESIMRLGFIPEGMMIHYGPNKENYVRYVRV